MTKCNCFSENLEKVKEKVIKDMPKGASDINIWWDGGSLFFSGDYSPVNPKINTSYRAKKKSGEPAKNLTKSSLSLFAEFCCYCGRKLKKSGKE